MSKAALLNGDKNGFDNDELSTESEVIKPDSFVSREARAGAGIFGLAGNRMRGPG